MEVSGRFAETRSRDAVVLAMFPEGTRVLGKLLLTAETWSLLPSCFSSELGEEELKKERGNPERGKEGEEEKFVEL